ncbi:MAG: SDR family oxidoreductase [Acidobacteriota bacterium]|nr:MAG: SDR family oxidoreductase [Acidobacteriota bacterium]
MTIVLILVVYALLLSIGLAINGHNCRTGPFEDAPIAKPGRLLIIGATGGTGRQLLEQALGRGYSVTALVRDPSKLRLDDPRLKVVRGDVMDPDSLKGPMQGQDAVLSALGHKRFFYPTRILSEGTRNVIGAMKEHGVARLVCETSLGIGNSGFRMGLWYSFIVIPLVLHLYFWDKTRQERLIARSGLDWVIVRPAVLRNGKKKGRIVHGRDIGNFILTRRITRADVADFMLDQLENDRYLRAAVGIRN